MDRYKGVGNIFELYIENGRRFPFFVRREWWAGGQIWCVVSLSVPRQEFGLDGVAWGYRWPNEFYGDMREIPCAGRHQWRLTPDPAPQIPYRDSQGKP
jgi:hypothetical protein